MERPILKKIVAIVIILIVSILTLEASLYYYSDYIEEKEYREEIEARDPIGLDYVCLTNTHGVMPEIFVVYEDGTYYDLIIDDIVSQYYEPEYQITTQNECEAVLNDLDVQMGTPWLDDFANHTYFMKAKKGILENYTGLFNNSKMVEEFVNCENGYSLSASHDVGWHSIGIRMNNTVHNVSLYGGGGPNAFEYYYQIMDNLWYEHSFISQKEYE